MCFERKDPPKPFETPEAQVVEFVEEAPPKEGEEVPPEECSRTVSHAVSSCCTANSSSSLTFITEYPYDLIILYSNLKLLIWAAILEYFNIIKVLQDDRPRHTASWFELFI